MGEVRKRSGLHVSQSGGSAAEELSEPDSGRRVRVEEGEREEEWLGSIQTRASTCPSWSTRSLAPVPALSPVSCASRSTF